MRMLKIVAGAGLVLALAGCDLVATKHPVGEPLAVQEEEWQGTWMHDDGPLTVRVVDAEKGLLEVAWIEEKEDRLVLESIEVRLGRFEDQLFASIAGVEDMSDLLWSSLGREGDRVYLWWPRPEAFQRLVSEGLLPGKVDDGDVTLDRLDESHLRLLVSEEHGLLYQWQEPMTFRRLR